MERSANTLHREPWNNGKIVGQKAPFKVQDVWALRVRRDVCHGDQVATRGVVMWRKNAPSCAVRNHVDDREALQAWTKQARLKSDDFLFPSRLHDSPRLGTRQYARILEGWAGASSASTVPSTEVNDPLELSEQTEV
jgi:hypothetical protein